MAILIKGGGGDGGGGGGGSLLTYYATFDELRAIVAVPGRYYRLLNPQFELTYFVSADTLHPDEEPNVIICANGYRLKIIGVE